VFAGDDGWALGRSLVSRGDLKLAWIRRAALADVRPAEIPPGFDSVVEIADLAAANNSAAKAPARPAIVPVAPITMFDEADVLPRHESANALGLDANKPAILVRLDREGEETGTLWTSVASHLSEASGFQIAIHAPSIGPVDAARWPRAKRLVGPAIGQYLAAFDFCVSGAGYEAFHEIVSHALPAILVASAHAAGDEAATRAKFAEKAGLALCLDEARLDQLPQMVTVLSNEKARAHLRENCRTFRRDNGAAAAAHALETLVDG
jgi:hypothetical protein